MTEPEIKNGYVNNNKSVQLENRRFFSHKEVPKKCRELFIFSGYRYPNYTVTQCLTSLVQMHNETMNCWTHIAACVYFLWVTYKSCTEHNTASIPLLISGFSNFLLFAGSSAAHTFNSISIKWRIRLFLFDYSAISFGASGVAVAYASYLPESVMIMKSKNIFLLVTVILCLVGIIGCSLSMVKFDGSKFAPCMKVSSFSLVAVIGNIPMVNYTLYTSGFTNAEAKVLGQINYMFMIYVFLKCLAGIVNASSMPERLKLGMFDCLGHSHQLFHIIVFLALALQYDLIFILKNQNGHLVTNTDIARGFITISVAWPLFVLTMIYFASKVEDDLSNKKTQ